jgi:hypothetical protein
MIELDEDFLICDDDRCVLLAEDLTSDTEETSHREKFNKVLGDVAKVYPDAVLVGAVAAAKYIRHPEKPRTTHDVDVLLDEKDFTEFLIDEIPENTLERLETYFDDSDSANHSMKHRSTGIYVDFLSTESKPIRKKLIRHILRHRKQATHLMKDGDRAIEILKPEYLLAMKVIRYSKDPKTERGMSDRVDIVKVLKTMRDRNIAVEHDRVREFLNRHEITNYDRILKEAAAEEGE